MDQRSTPGPRFGEDASDSSRNGRASSATEPEPARGPAGEVAGLLEAVLAPPWRGREGRAETLLGRYDLASLSRLGEEALRREGALTRFQARRLWAAFELGRHVEGTLRPDGESLANPARVYRLMRTELRGLEVETFHALVLDARHRLRARVRVSEGTLTTSLVHPREVFRPVIRCSGAALIVVHNHPSGDPEPSPEDVAVTRRLVEAGRLLGIPLLDHVIVGEGRWVSLRERMSFDAGAAGAVPGATS